MRKPVGRRTRTRATGAGGERRRPNSRGVAFDHLISSGSVAGTAMLSVVTVYRLLMNSNLVACITVEALSHAGRLSVMAR